MKIVYCVDSIYTQGGIQVVTIQKANALAELGHQVYIVVTDHKQNKASSRLSDKVQLINLEVNYYEDDWKGYIYVIKGVILKRRIHKKKLFDCLNNIKPDIVVAPGTSEKYFLPKLRISSNPVFIREIHNFKYYRKAYANNLRDKIVALIGDFIDFKIGLKNYDHIVVLTKEDKETNWKHEENVSYMHNPLTISSGKISSLDNKKIVSAGRLCVVKNHISLIRAWKYVNEKHPDWILEIWGDGDQKNNLIEEIKYLNLSGVIFLKGYTYDIASVFADASCFVLTSKAEGLPLVIVEAMSCGLPVVSYKCPCGPKDIIEHGKNGFLCEVNDEKNLASCINILIENKNLRKEMGRGALKRSENFNLEEIAKKWELLFLTLLKNKRNV